MLEHVPPRKEGTGPHPRSSSADKRPPRWCRASPEVNVPARISRSGTTRPTHTIASWPQIGHDRPQLQPVERTTADSAPSGDSGSRRVAGRSVAGRGCGSRGGRTRAECDEKARAWPPLLLTRHRRVAPRCFLCLAVLQVRSGTCCCPDRVSPTGNLHS